MSLQVLQHESLILLCWCCPKSKIQHQQVHNRCSCCIACELLRSLQHEIWFSLSSCCCTKFFALDYNIKAGYSAVHVVLLASWRKINTVEISDWNSAHQIRRHSSWPCQLSSCGSLSARDPDPNHNLPGLKSAERSLSGSPGYRRSLQWCHRHPSCGRWLLL